MKLHRLLHIRFTRRAGVGSDCFESLKICWQRERDFFFPPSLLAGGETVLTRIYFVILTPIQILPALEAAVDPPRLLDPDPEGPVTALPHPQSPPT